MPHTTRKLATLLLLSLALPQASAQEVLYAFEGDSPDERFGLAVSGA